MRIPLGRSASAAGNMGFCSWRSASNLASLPMSEFGLIPAVLGIERRVGSLRRASIQAQNMQF